MISDSLHTASSMAVPSTAVPWPRPQIRSARGDHVLPHEIGVYRRSELVDMGASTMDIRRAVAKRRLTPVTRGFYARPDADARVVHAVRNSLRVTCTDGLDTHCVWTPAAAPGTAGRLHCYAPRARATSSDVIMHPSPKFGTWPEDDLVASLDLSLLHAALCLDGESAAIVLESVLDDGRRTPDDIRAFLASLPQQVRSQIGRLSDASGSGSETRVVRALRRRGFLVEQQVFVEGVGYVDAYVGGIFLEIDGRGPHELPGAFDRDRRRDLELRRLGLEVLRLSYEQVWNDWIATERALRRAIRLLGPQGRRAVARLG